MTAETELDQRFRRIQFEQIVEQRRNDLDNWFDNSSRILRQFYENKKKEIELRNDRLKRSIKQIGSHLDKVKTDSEQENDEQTAKIRNLWKNRLELDLKIVEFETRPIAVETLKIDEQAVLLPTFFDLNRIENDFVEIPFRGTKFRSIGANNEFILFQKESHLYTVDRQANETKRLHWPEENFIRYICWVEFLRKFLVLTPKTFFFVDNHFNLTEPWKNEENRTFFSATASNKNLFVSTFEFGSSILQIDVSQGVLSKEWKPPESCLPNECILDVQSNNQTLALVLFDAQSEEKSFVLKSIPTFEQIWKVVLVGKSNPNLTSCCSINDSDWIVVDGNTKKIFQICSDGKILRKLTLSSTPYRVDRFAENQLVISHEKELKIYKPAI